MATNGDNTMILSWDTPAESTDIDFHEYRYKKAADAEYPETWTAILESAPGGANQNSFAVPGLTYGVTYTFQVRATNSLGAGDTSDEASAKSGEGLPVCDRTPGVRDAIVSEIAGVNDCAEVTATHLSAMGFLPVRAAVSELKAGDFDGLPLLQTLRITANLGLTRLPEGIFDALSSLVNLDLSGNRLSELPDGAFDGLTSLTDLD